MKFVFRHIFVFIIAALLSVSCVRELFGTTEQGEEGMVDIAIPFGSPWSANVDISTRSKLSLSDESHVFNLYLLIFDGNSASSNKVYGHYFDGSNLGASTESNWWSVTNMATDNDPVSHGTLHIRTAKKAGCTVVAVANMNPDDLDVSPGLLSTIKTYGDLQGLVATQVKSEIAANSGYFMMTAQVDGVNIQGLGSDNYTDPSKKLMLRRLYAKVTFDVQITSAGAAAGIRKFVPDKWQVINIPVCSYLLERDIDDDIKWSWSTPGKEFDAALTNGQFFNTPEEDFEIETLALDPSVAPGDPGYPQYVYYNGGQVKASCHSFTFYMMENRKQPASTLSNYQDRERQNKDGSGKNTGHRYAPEYSTYVLMTGKIVMGVTSESGNANATLDANVQYEIHLGDFGADVNDFNILRNHSYVYKIYISGADDIKTEVITGTENEPGATGRVVVAEEEVFDSDCHYSTQVIAFHASLIDPSQISWYVETPFNPEGAGPDEGMELSDIDYKWVEYHVNNLDGARYSENRVEYKPRNWDGYHDLGIEPGTKGHTMYVDELVRYLQQQKNQYDAHLADPSQPASDFDNGLLANGDPDPNGPKILVTAFVNEYYYEEHPTKGGFDPTLWRLVVNHPMRRMHILASSRKSADGESMSIGSSFTIQQRSIQSIYSIEEGLSSAWGMEFTDDSFETGLNQFWSTTEAENRNNFSTTNGRLNTLKLWMILNPDGTEDSTPRYWGTYLDLEGQNETPRLLDDYNYLRYSCLSRNRDNDGDGVIDPEEIRWYMASDIQLIGVFMGAYSIEGDARLYQKNAEDREAPYNQKDKWRQHIVASNIYTPPQSEMNKPEYATWPNSNMHARLIWAEEGINGSRLSYTSNTEQTASFSTRCVRNLGYYYDSGVRKDISQAPPAVEPEPYVTHERKHLNADGTIEDYPESNPANTYNDRTFYVFDCSHINTTSLREPVDHELVSHDENSPMACLSRGFVTAPVVNSVNLNSYTSYSFDSGDGNPKTYNLKDFLELNNYLSASFGGLDTDFHVCPEGYRLPNVRELAVIWNVLSSFSTGDSDYLGKNETIPCRTYWSFGTEGNNKVSAWGWGCTNQKMLMAKHNSHKVSKPRCVKDL